MQKADVSLQSMMREIIVVTSIIGRYRISCTQFALRFYKSIDMHKYA
jgi:hypothetical protein